MSTLKKVFLALLVLSMVVGVFCSCSSQRSSLKDWMQDTNKLRVLSTTAQVNDLVAAVGGDRVNALVLIQGDLDPHSYELVKGDDEKFAVADLIFYNGLGLEHGASLSSTLRVSSKSIALGEKIANRHPEKILKKGEIIDPHLWMDISVWKLSLEPIVEELVKKDPEGAPYYKENANQFLVEMERVHDEIRSRMLSIPQEKRHLLTSHDAFRYFAKSYLSEIEEQNWEERFAAPEGLSPDGQLSSVNIQKMIEFLKIKRIFVLFPESNISRDSIEKIAAAGKEMGLSVRVCTEPLYGDSMGGLSYLEMMQSNAELIARYLQ